MKIICYGDSNTYGWDPRDFFGNPYSRPWPKVLSELSGAETINLGVPGREIPNFDMMLDYMKGDIESSLPADLLIVMLGTNDLLNSMIPNPKRVAKRMDSMLCYLREWLPDQKILLVVPAAPQLWNEDYLSASVQLASEYHSLASKYHTEYVSAVNWKLPLAFDDIHLTQEAHDTFAKKLYEYMMEHNLCE